MKSVKMPESVYHDLNRHNDGVCTLCGQVTENEHVEPDATPENSTFECTECNRTGGVYGIEMALVAGAIEITDEPESDSDDDLFLDDDLDWDDLPF